MRFNYELKEAVRKAHWAIQELLQEHPDSFYRWGRKKETWAILDELGEIEVKLAACREDLKQTELFLTGEIKNA